MAGSLKRELKDKYGIQPKVTHAYGELEVIVNGQGVFSYQRERRIPTIESLTDLIRGAA